MYSKSLLYVNIGKLSGVNEHYISPYYFSVEFLYIRILLMNKPNLTSYIHESPLSLRTRLPVSVQSESDRIQRPRIKALISCTHIPGLSSHKHCITIGRGLSTYLAASPPLVQHPYVVNRYGVAMDTAFTARPHTPPPPPLPCQVWSSCSDVSLDDAPRHFVIPES